MDSDQLKAERAKLVVEARKIVDVVESETRNMNGEESEKFAKLMVEVDTFGQKINTVEKAESLKRAEAELAVSYRKTSPQQIATQRAAGNRGQALRSWLLRAANTASTNEDLENAAHCGFDLSSRSTTISLGRSEQRSVQTGVLNTPDFGQGFDRALKAYGGAKALVRTLSTSNGVVLKIPTVDDTSNIAQIVGETGSVAVTPDPTFASVSLGAYKYSTLGIQVSLEVLQDSIIPLESLLSDLLAERLGRAVNAHITNGTGSGQPFGLTARAANSGVVLGGTVASPAWTFDSVFKLIASVDPAYRNAPGAGFMLNDTTIWNLVALKDTVGRYLWTPSLQAGQPSTLAGYPVYTNQDMPVASAASNKVCVFGDFSRYTWREVSDLVLYRLDELYIMNGMVAFMGLYRADGNLVNVNAVKYLTAPAS